MCQQKCKSEKLFLGTNGQTKCKSWYFLPVKFEMIVIFNFSSKKLSLDGSFTSALSKLHMANNCASYAFLHEIMWHTGSQRSTGQITLLPHKYFKGDFHEQDNMGIFADISNHWAQHHAKKELKKDIAELKKDFTDDAGMLLCC